MGFFDSLSSSIGNAFAGNLDEGPQQPFLERATSSAGSFVGDLFSKGVGTVIQGAQEYLSDAVPVWTENLLGSRTAEANQLYAPTAAGDISQSRIDSQSFWRNPLRETAEFTGPSASLSTVEWIAVAAIAAGLVFAIVKVG